MVTVALILTLSVINNIYIIYIYNDEQLVLFVLFKVRF
jgi:hypothetical protein